jgi:hypothetical protein
VPAGKFRMVGVGEVLGDVAIEVSIDHSLVKRPPLADDAVGERNPPLGPFANPCKP